MLDPLTRKLLVPAQNVHYTVAMERVDRTPSLCLLYMQGECKSGEKCRQLHGDLHVLLALREKTKPSCCLVHGDHLPSASEVLDAAARDVQRDASDDVRPVPEWLRRTSISIRGVTIPCASLSMTQGLLRLVASHRASSSPSLTGEHHAPVAGAGEGPPQPLSTSDRKAVAQLLDDVTDPTAIEGDPVVIPCEAKHVCRLHAGSNCRFREECLFLHVCLDITRDPSLLGKYVVPEEPPWNQRYSGSAMMQPRRGDASSSTPSSQRSSRQSGSSAYGSRQPVGVGSHLGSSASGDSNSSRGSSVSSQSGVLPSPGASRNHSVIASAHPQMAPLFMNAPMVAPPAGSFAPHQFLSGQLMPPGVKLMPHPQAHMQMSLGLMPFSNSSMQPQLAAPQFAYVMGNGSAPPGTVPVTLMQPTWGPAASPQPSSGAMQVAAPPGGGAFYPQPFTFVNVMQPQPSWVMAPQGTVLMPHAQQPSQPPQFFIQQHHQAPHGQPMFMQQPPQMFAPAPQSDAQQQ